MSCLLDIQLAVKCWVGISQLVSLFVFFIPLWINWHEENVCVRDQLISCSPALWKCQSKPPIFTFTIILVIDFRSISFDHRCLITWLSFLKGLVQSYVWWGKDTFGVTVWSSTWWCVNRWVGELLSGMMVFEATPEEAWATLSAINFPDVQVRHHGCFCG